jgi:4-hydroxy-3-polyprenylbenzoate decarboxylase
LREYFVLYFLHHRFCDELREAAVSRRIAVALTGASGSIYAERLLAFLSSHVERVYLVATDSGVAVAQHELVRAGSDGFSLLSALKGEMTDAQKQVVRVFQNNDLFAPIASGSSAPTDMVIVPASMGTVARIASGISSNLVDRAADVVLKEKKRLIVVPRETPLNTIHLENLLKLSQLGAHIIPAMPAFYQKPKSLDDAIDFVVGRVVDALGLDHELYKRWNSRMA